MLSKIFLYVFVFALTACNSNENSVALGTLERDRIAHTATVSEVITELPIKPGSQVIKGNILVKLDSTLQETLVAKAQAQVHQAKANLDKVRNGAREEEIAAAKAQVVGAKAALVESKANYQRALTLIKSDLASQAALDSALAILSTNQAVLDSAKEQLLQLTNGARIEDINIAEAILATHIAQLHNEQKKLADLTITAKRDGLLDNLPWNLGERVTAGSPVAILLAGNAPFARVYIPEPYRVKIKTGDHLQVTVDGLNGPLEGTVRWISTEPAFSPYYALNQAERANLMFLAEVLLPDSASGLPIGVPAQVKMP